MTSNLNGPKLLILLCLLFFCNTAFSRSAGLVICNKTHKYPLRVATIWYSGNAYVKKWTSRGWSVVNPGACEQVIAGTNFVNNNYYLSALEKRGKDDYWIVRPKNPKMEEFFCVREAGKFPKRFPNGFELTRSSLSGLRNSSSSYSLQLFNIFIRSKEDTATTFSF